MKSYHPSLIPPFDSLRTNTHEKNIKFALEAARELGNNDDLYKFLYRYNLRKNNGIPIIHSTKISSITRKRVYRDSKTYGNTNMIIVIILFLQNFASDNRNFPCYENK